MQQQLAKSLLDDDDVLIFRHPRRIDAGYVESADGVRSFVVHYGEHELEFDDERDFAFAEALVAARRFRVADAARWCSSDAWPRVREHLEVLVEETVLEREADSRSEAPHAVACTHASRGGRREPLTWSAIGSACARLSAELTGERLGVEVVESLIPVNDLARAALDEAGRQVGENNVAERLRVDVPTEWAVCRYAGSRNAHRCPMNVTALRKVNREWGDTMATLLELRARLVVALAPEAARLTLGQTHLLAMLSLTWSGYLMVRARAPVENGALPSVASSLFMLADGVRMTTAHIFYAGAQVRRADEHVEPAELARVADREQLLVTDTGVCAGPPGKIDELLGLVVDGGIAEGTSQLGASTDVDELLAYAAPAIRAALVGRVLVHETRRRRQALAVELGSGPATELVHGLADDGIAWTITPEQQHAFERSIVALSAEAGRLSARERDHAPALETLWRPAPPSEADDIDRGFAATSARWRALPAALRRTTAAHLADERAMKRAAAELLTALQRRINCALDRTGEAAIVDDRLLAAFFRIDGRPRDLETVLATSYRGTP